MQIYWSFSGATGLYSVHVGDDVVYSTSALREAQLFIAELKLRLGEL
jgi:hypothetical protein